MRVLSVANQKGGCGKSTVSINLASAFANAGLRTLVIDNDPQGHATQGLGIAENDFRLSTRDLYLTSDVLVDEIAHEVRENLEVVPAGIDLATVEPSLNHDPFRAQQLRERIVESQLPHDLCIIDNPPHVGTLTFNALLASAEVLIPVDPGRFTFDAVGAMRATLDMIQSERGHRLRMHILANGFDLRMRFARDMLERLAMTYPGSLLDAQIHRTVRLREAADRGMPVDVHDSESRATEDFQLLAEEVWSLPLDLVLEDLQQWDSLLHGPMSSDSGVQFEVDFPQAREVAVTGDFTAWSVEGEALVRQPDGSWRVELPIEPGVFEYKFIVDGVWKVDPTNPEKVRNSYGQLNSVVMVGGGEGPETSDHEVGS
jgi:chromosome partitioning protein